MIQAKHNVLLFLCIVFLFALAIRSSIKSYIPYVNVEGYEDRSYTLDMGAITDKIQSEYLQKVINRQTIYGKTQEQAMSSVTANPYASCEGLFKCAPVKSTNDITSTTSTTTQPSASLASSAAGQNRDNAVPSNQEVSYTCPPQLSAEDMLNFDLMSAEEKALERAMTDSQNIREAAVESIRTYQDTLRDSMMDSFMKFNSISNASNMLEASVQQQAVSGNMPDAMMDGITAATQPITDKVNELSNSIQQMRAIVDRTRARCNSVRFAFGRGCRI